jgi:hypothetical protein
MKNKIMCMKVHTRLERMYPTFVNLFMLSWYTLFSVLCFSSSVVCILVCRGRLLALLSYEAGCQLSNFRKRPRSKKTSKLQEIGVLNLGSVLLI